MFQLVDTVGRVLLVCVNYMGWMKKVYIMDSWLPDDGDLGGLCLLVMAMPPAVVRFEVPARGKAGSAALFVPGGCGMFSVDVRGMSLADGCLVVFV